ncbi:MAG: two-component system response regulator [Candidatus Methylomirabilales bacterium]
MGTRPILVIDDDHAVCELVTSILTSTGFTVHSASDGPTGIETARAEQPAVILLDMMMPGIDGISTCQRLKRDPVLADIPVVGVTGSDNLRYAGRAFCAGAAFFLAKPFGLNALVNVVELALESAQRGDPMDRRRRRPRFLAEVPVRCLIGQDAEATREVVGQTGNMSLSGLLLLLPEEIVPGTSLRLRLGLPEGPITADGTVIWQDPQSLEDGRTPHGIRFVRFVEEADLVRYRRLLGELSMEDEAAALSVSGR